jgi:hypothetical protein
MSVLNTMDVHLRRDMRFGTPRKLSSKASWVDGSPESSRAYSKTSLRGRSGSGVAHLIGLGISASSATTSSSGQKRKRDGRFDGVSRLKRSKSDSSHASTTNVRIKEGELDAVGAHRIQETVVDSLADCRNKWQRNNFDSIQEAGADSLTDCESETYGQPSALLLGNFTSWTTSPRISISQRAFRGAARCYPRS